MWFLAAHDHPGPRWHVRQGHATDLSEFGAAAGGAVAVELRDVVMMQVLMALWVANRKVYGAILHTAGRLVRRARQVWLRLPDHWPWTNDLLAAYQRLATIT